jgi:hypothetical protein
MDSATILVLLLCAGVVTLLAWFEINSRRNAAGKSPESTLAQSGVSLPKKGQTSAEPKRENRKAA